MNKLSREYKALAESQGFVLVRCNKHAIFKHKDGGILVCPASPSDSRRGLKQLQRDINRVLNRHNIRQPGK